MKNFEIIERIPNDCCYRGASVLTIPYKESLTIIDAERQVKKNGISKIKPIYNHPKDLPIFENGFESSTQLPKSHKLTIPSRHIRNQLTTQLFNIKKPYVMVIDGKLYELYGDTYRLNKEEIGTSFALNQVNGETNTNIKLMNLVELEEFLFPLFNRRIALVMDLDGYIYEKPADLIPSIYDLNGIYEDYLEKSKEQISLISKIIQSSKNNSLTTNYSELDLPQDIFYETNKGVSLFKNLLYVEGTSREDLKISILDIDLLDYNKFLVRVYDVPVVKYETKALRFLQEVNKVPVKRYYK